MLPLRGEERIRYAKCAQLAVIAVDNDGDVDLDASGDTEDPRHPRHSNHPGEVVAACRYCQLSQIVKQVRPELHWLPKKPSTSWPILVAVPVELIETWLLMIRGDVGAQRRRRSVQKQQLYGKPEATRDDVLNVALPLIRSMSTEDVASLAQASPSFQDFRNQISDEREIICGSAECW